MIILQFYRAKLLFRLKQKTFLNIQLKFSTFYRKAKFRVTFLPRDAL